MKRAAVRAALIFLAFAVLIKFNHAVDVTLEIFDA